MKIDIPCFTESSIWEQEGPCIGTNSFHEGLGQRDPLRGSPEAAHSALGIAPPAHLFNGWQAPECPIP